MKVRVMCREFECREDIHYKTQTGTSCEKCNSKAFRLGIEPASSGLLDQCSTALSYRSRCRQLGREFSIYINEMVMPMVIHLMDPQASYYISNPYITLYNNHYCRKIHTYNYNIFTNILFLASLILYNLFKMPHTKQPNV